MRIPVFFRQVKKAAAPSGAAASLFPTMPLAGAAADFATVFFFTIIKNT